MGKGGQNVSTQQGGPEARYTWEQIQQHDKKSDKWVVIEDQVYDITEWAYRHPGGSKVISHFAGQDATEAFKAFHNDLSVVRKYMKPIRRGALQKKEDAEAAMKEDFDNLRVTAQKMGLFSPSTTFFVLIMAHLIAFELMAYFSLAWFGTGWIPFLFSVLCLATVQAQAGWSQHDYGHLSVFKSTIVNHALHLFTMNFTKGASRSWWNHLHYQHHAKPNVLDKDPDVRLEAVFVLGEEMPKRMAKDKNSMPYNWQHRYFFIIGPPLLFPIYFQYMTFRHPIIRGQWLDVFIMCLYYLKMFYLYVPMMGVGWFCLFYFLMRCVESHWFVWVSQSNHIPMEIADDKNRPWLPLQLHATCNVERNFFNDWFTGHLNFQIEHHCFPTMPRHNLYKVAPLVKSLCEKHGVPYQVKPISVAFNDIVKSLKHSGEIWHAYYHAYHFS